MSEKKYNRDDYSKGYYCYTAELTSGQVNYKSTNQEEKANKECTR